MTKQPNESSNRKTPWDKINPDKLTPLINFIKNEHSFNYEMKHPDLFFSNESKPINTKIIKTCPYSGSTNVVKNGFTRGHIQKYKCKTCKKYFTNTTNTLMENHKLPLDQHIEFLLQLFSYEPIKSLGRINKNSSTTSRYWLEKVFMILKNYQDDIVLSGTVYIDETYVCKVNKLLFDNKGNRIHERSRTQYCIGIGCDENYVYARIESMGHPTYKSTKECFDNHIKSCSYLVHDSEKCHMILFRNKPLINCVYNASKQLKGLKDAKNPLEPINIKCKLLKKFLRSHGGFDREHLQDYLNLFCFIHNPPRNKLEKINYLLEYYYMLPAHLKYRDFYKKKEETRQISSND